MNRALPLHALWPLAALLGTSCSPYQVQEFTGPDYPAPPAYAAPLAQATAPAAPTVGTSASPWWLEFGEESLNSLISHALEHNFTLAAARARLEQAEAISTQAESGLLPALSVNGQANRFRAEERFTITGEGPGALQAPTVVYQNDFITRAPLTWELDLWKRLRSGANAATKRLAARSADIEATALMLSGQIAETWIEAVVQDSLEALVKEQLATSNTLLELTEVRFSVGRGTALDVLQQRQQVSALEAELPRVRAARDQALNQLAVLTTLPPRRVRDLALPQRLPALPPLPEAGLPADLIAKRPDVRAALLDLQASEFDVAVAVAERFPRISLGLTYDFRASDIADLFQQSLAILTGSFDLPLTDGGQRRAVVRQREAQVKELLTVVNTTYLQALVEVENSFTTEYHQNELLERLAEQSRHAAATLEEARSRYSNGLTDYLQVTLAVQSLQTIQRRERTEQALLLSNRVRLYRSLGAPWMTALVERDPQTSESKG